MERKWKQKQKTQKIERQKNEHEKIKLCIQIHDGCDCSKSSKYLSIERCHWNFTDTSWKMAKRLFGVIKCALS